MKGQKILPEDTSANVMVTTACDRRCRACCCRDIVHNRPTCHFSPSAIAEEIALLKTAGTIYLTGGEPTLHPDFGDLVVAARKARGKRTLILMTNGSKLIEHARHTALIDVVKISIFSSNEERIAQKYLAIKPPKTKLVSIPLTHIDLGGGPLSCKRRWRTVSVMDGRIYPCCVACGIDTADSIPLTHNWYTEVRTIPTPCHRCVFGTKKI